MASTEQLEIPRAQRAAHIVAQVAQTIGAARPAIQIDFDPQQIAKQLELVVILA
jgi:hypothetical protein